MTASRSRRLLMAHAAVAAVFVASQSPGGVIFDQSFGSSSTVGDYVSSTPNSGQFNDISADGQINTVSVTGGQLVFDMQADSNGTTAPNPNGGLLRSTDLASPVPTLMLLQVTFTYSRDTAASNFGPGPTIQVGDFPSTATTYTSTVAADRFDDIGLRRNGASQYYIEMDSINRVTAAFGAEVALSYYLNDSGASATFTGPDGLERSLSDNSVSLFVGNTLVANNIAASNGASSDLSTFRIVAVDGADTSLSINRITIRDDLGAPVPEPAGLVILGGLATLALTRRRQA